MEILECNQIVQEEFQFLEESSYDVSPEISSNTEEMNDVESNDEIESPENVQERMVQTPTK